MSGAVAGNASLRDALAEALAGTSLEARCLEELARQNLRDVAAAQRRRRRARSRAKRADARREALLAS